jgi:alpha-D-xyloside xylohydrolase
MFNELEERGYFLRNPDGSDLHPPLVPLAVRGALPVAPAERHHRLHQPRGVRVVPRPAPELIDLGVAVMKTDYGEAVPPHVVAHNGDTGHRLHNVYTLLYNRCVFEAFERYGKGAPMVWGRSGWAGVQRSPVQWGGDPQCDWEGIAASIRGGLSWGMSGGPFYSHDIGGFARGQVPASSTSAGPRPASTARTRASTASASASRGRSASRLRRSCAAGPSGACASSPTCRRARSSRRAPACRSCARCRSPSPTSPTHGSRTLQYLLGPSLLVAPVVHEGGRVRISLPRGRWFELATGEWLEGGRSIERDVPLDSIPLFGREGHLLPLGPVVQHTGELPAPLTVDEVVAFGPPTVGIELPRRR